MPTKKTPTSKETEINILQMKEGSMTVNIVGTSPLIMNRMSEKAKHELLFPALKLKDDERSARLKHDPLAEYRASAYQTRDDSAPTRLRMMSTAFKGAMRTAALDMPGVTKAKIGRLTYVTSEYVGIYGIPKMLMSVVRSADINKTPDIRSRLIIPEWAAALTVNYNATLLKEISVANLLASGGIYVAVGDWRVEKGSGNFGRFRLAGVGDLEFQSIVRAGGMAAQDAALKEPGFYDEETEEMFTWFKSSAVERGFEVAA